ncbi:MAG: hypothetical protein N2C14_21480 [Planctomycetales bacterium]
MRRTAARALNFVVLASLFPPGAVLGVDQTNKIPGGPEAKKAVEARRGKTELSKLAARMKPGTWAELKTETPKGLWSAPPPSKGLHVGTWSDDAHWDSRTGQFLFFGVRQTRKFVAYSEEKNAWRVIEFHQAANAPALKQQYGHQYSLNALDPERSRFHAGGYRYDVLADKWSQLPPAVPGRNSMVQEYFSGMNGLLSLARQPPGTLRFYSEDKQSWSSLGVIPIHGYHSMARHNPFREEVLFAGGNDSRAVVVLYKDGKIKRMKDFPEPLTVRHGILTVDPASGRYLIMARERRFLEFDSEKNEYRLIDDFTKTPWPFHHYDAPLTAFIPEYDVTMWADRKVFLYKHNALGEIGKNPR